MHKPRRECAGARGPAAQCAAGGPLTKTEAAAPVGGAAQATRTERALPSWGAGVEPLPNELLTRGKPMVETTASTCTASRASVGLMEPTCAPAAAQHAHSTQAHVSPRRHVGQVARPARGVHHGPCPHLALRQVPACTSPLPLPPSLTPHPSSPHLALRQVALLAAGGQQVAHHRVRLHAVDEDGNRDDALLQQHQSHSKVGSAQRLNASWSRTSTPTPQPRPASSTPPPSWVAPLPPPQGAAPWSAASSPPPHRTPAPAGQSAA